MSLHVLETSKKTVLIRFFEVLPSFRSLNGLARYVQ